MFNSLVHPQQPPVTESFCMGGTVPGALYMIIFTTAILRNNTKEKTRRRQELSNLTTCQSQESNSGSHSRSFAPNCSLHYFLLDLTEGAASLLVKS